MHCDRISAESTVIIFQKFSCSKTEKFGFGLVNPSLGVLTSSAIHNISIASCLFTF